MRRMMWFTAGFALACAACAYLLPVKFLLLIAGILAAFSLGLMIIAGRNRKLRIPGVLLLGCAVGVGWFFCYDLFYVNTARAYDGQTLPLTVEVTDYSWDTAYGTAAQGKLQLEDRSFQVQVYLQERRELEPGDTLTGEFRLRLTAAGGEKQETYHQGKGIFLLLYARNDVAVSHPSDPGGYWPARLRQKILALLDAVFPEDARGFAKALLMGETAELDYETDTALKLSGIRHVAAVSGLHVSILFTFLYQFAGKRRYFTAIVGLPVLLLFAAVAGFSPSVTRAVLMQALMILAMLFNREYDPPTALAFAVLVMLGVNPLAVTSVSLQLSAGCMVGIFLFSGKISGYLLDDKRLGPAKGKSLKARLSRWTVSSISISLSSMAVTAPLSAFYFGTVSLIGILTNLLTLWLITYIFYGIALACIAGAVLLPLGQGIAWLIAWGIRIVLGTADVFSRFPLAAVYTCSVYILIWLVLSYVLLGLFFLGKKKQPGLLCFGITAALAVAVALSWLEPRLRPIQATVLDVGQGQCVLVQSYGKTYMVDCGGDTGDLAADSASQMLLSQGISRLDGLILTHYDRDHAGGVLSLMTRIGVDALYLPEIADDTGIKDALADGYCSGIQWVRDTTVITAGSMKISMFPEENPGDSNESSLCILFQRENCDILITGDRSAAGERRLMAQTELPRAELLVVGHHGADSSTCFDLLAAVQPEFAVISVGAGNPYGHPRPEVLRRLEFFDSKVYRTDLNGNVVFRG